MTEHKYKIVDAHNWQGGVDEAIRYIHSKWGRAENYSFYSDAILHYGEKIPRFFILTDGQRLLGCGALIANDFVSRHDLLPWYACHFVEEELRGKALGSLLLSHATKLAGDSGFEHVYLSTDHDGYYEKYGWERIEDGFEPSGASTRIYRYCLNPTR